MQTRAQRVQADAMRASRLVRDARDAGNAAVTDTRIRYGWPNYVRQQATYAANCARKAFRLGFQRPSQDGAAGEQVGK